MTPEQRLHAILALSKYTGLGLTSDFLRHTSVHCPAAGIETMHSLVEGIFKPKDSEYALTIWSRSAAGADLEIYPDEFRELPGGGWQLEYSAKNGPLDSAINRSLFSNDGEGIVGPTNPICRPDAGALSWHRQYRFRH